MDIVKAPKIRIVSGTPPEVEIRLEPLCAEYAPIQWNYAVVENELVMTVVLIHEAEIRKLAIASQLLPNGVKR